MGSFHSTDRRLFVKSVQGGFLEGSTIEGYKSDNSGLEVGKDPHLCALVNGFYTERPVQRTVLPKWDLAPSALTKAPLEYSNFGSVELKFLTFKKVFLLALATGARKGEIHALDHSFYMGGGQILSLPPSIGGFCVQDTSGYRSKDRTDGFLDKSYVKGDG